jgi:hypothetical protein
MFTSSFYWALVGALTSAGAVMFLLKDLERGRTDLIVGDGNHFDQKVTIRREQSPTLFLGLIIGLALCTTFMFVICALLIVEGLTSTELVGAISFSVEVAVLIPASWWVCTCLNPFRCESSRGGGISRSKCTRTKLSSSTICTI